MSTVIKAGQTGPILHRLSTVDLADHLAEADTVIEEAKRRAARIVADAKVQADRIREEANRSGYEIGHRQGRAEGTEAGRKAAHDEATRGFQQEHADIVAVMQQAVTAIDTIKEDLTIAARRDLLDFAVSMASKLTFAIGRLYRESVLENLDRALRLVGSRTNLTVRVHPDDVASVKKFAGSALAHVEASQAVKIIADDTMAPGGCRVENDRTSIDATLETQVDELVSLLLGGNMNDA